MNSKARILQKLKESFKEGQERAIHDMSPEGIQANRKAFLDRSGITRRADELNRGSATMGMPVDVNQPGLYTGSRMEAPQGIGGAGGHFGVGGITMPETPGGLGVRGIGKGASGAGPAFQQHGLSGGPIRVQPRGGGGSGGPSGSGGLADRIAHYRAYAESKGLDPDLVTGIVMGEGHKGPNDSWANPDKSRSGKPGTSYGDFQVRRSAQGGMGDDFARSHPDVPMDEAHWKEQGDYAIDQMAKEGTGAWM